MTTIVKFFIYLLIFTVPIVWFSNHPGQVSIIWRGYLIELSFFILVIFLFLIIFATTMLSKIFLSIKSFPRQFTLRQKEKNLNLTRETLENITFSWINNDSKGMDIQARKIKRYTGDNIFSTMLLFQIALKSGEYDKAKKYLEILEKNRKTKFIAFKCKAMVLIKQNRRLEAKNYLEKAFAINPRDPWVCDNISVLLARTEKWLEAAKTLENVNNSFQLSSKRVGYLLKSGADPVLTYKISSDSIPVVLNVINFYLKQNNEEKVFEILKKTWRKLKFFGFVEAIFDETKFDIKLALKRFKLVNKALKSDLASDETKIAMAYASLRAKLWEKSRGFLVSIKKNNIDKRVINIWTELSNNSDRIKVPSFNNTTMESPYWYCQSCNLKFKAWEIICKECDGVGTVVWSKSLTQSESRDLINPLFE
ncbi:MAG: hypothetical protein CMM96_01935 [Rickettsiales bacterium]|nr:hypothetical protein [Rickettsiales bacterium]|tara:strand:- start:156 stop:1421 length:1266 start_codon:yes stop_codon:yes gene_type:complete